MSRKYMVTDGKRQLWAKSRVSAEFIAFWLGIKSYLRLDPQKISIVTITSVRYYETTLPGGPI